METMYDKNKRSYLDNKTGTKLDCYEVIDGSTMYYEDYVKKLQQENEELFVENMKLKDKLEQQRKEYQETYKDVREEIKELKQQNNILTEFEKWLEYEYEKSKNKTDIFHNFVGIKECLDNLQELKGKR